jgi:16S rRNA (guanine527-N7)-methyltransferase
MELTSAQRAQLAAVLTLLENDDHAPTAIRDRERAEREHVADSLVALRVAELVEAHRIADIGSGVGFPGLALAVALPRAEVNLVESQRRKCEFLGRVCAVAGVANARIVHSRVELWSEGIACNDAVLARALAPQVVVLEYAAPLLRVGGLLIDWRGRRDAQAERAADRAAAELGLRRSEVRAVEPFACSTDRHLHVFEKASETPPRFPRRPGVARKRPLGGC